MTVIPLRRRVASAVHRAPPRSDAARIEGSFCSPTGRTGTMTGSYRLEHIADAGVGSTGSGRRSASGVFTGELVDADGRLIGRGSRRGSAPVTATAHELIVGPVDVDLLGLRIHVPAFPIRSGPSATASPPGAIG